MKKLLSISLALILTGSFLLADNGKAEAFNNESAALIAAAIFLGPPLIWALAHDHHEPSPAYYGAYYTDPYPVRTRVIYKAPGYERYHGKRSYGHDRDWSEHRRHREYRRDRDNDRGRYSGRHDRHAD